MNDEAVVRHNPETVWPVPERFRSIYAHGVELRSKARLLFLSGQIGVVPDGSVDSHFEAQCEVAMTNVETLLEAAGMKQADIVKLVFYLTRAADLPTLGELRRKRWASPTPPACGGGSRATGIADRDRCDRRVGEMTAVAPGS